MMGHRITRYLVAAGLLALLTFTIWSATSEPEQPAAPRRDADEEPFGVMDDCVYTRTVAGERQAQLTAKTGLYYRDRQDVVLTQVEAQFHDQDRDIVVRSERGGFNLGSRAGELIGGVVGRTSDGITLRTTRLGFDAQNKRLHTDDAVLLEGPYFTLRGVGADADLTLAKAELRSAVEATAWGGKAP